MSLRLMLGYLLRWPTCVDVHMQGRNYASNRSLPSTPSSQNSSANAAAAAMTIQTALEWSVWSLSQRPRQLAVPHAHLRAGKGVPDGDDLMAVRSSR